MYHTITNLGSECVLKTTRKRKAEKKRWEMDEDHFQEAVVSAGGKNLCFYPLCGPSGITYQTPNTTHKITYPTQTHYQTLLFKTIRVEQKLFHKLSFQ